MAASLRYNPSPVERTNPQADNQLLVAGVVDSSGTRRKGNVRSWKPLPSSVAKSVIENVSLCVCLFLSLYRAWSPLVLIFVRD
jgi:hypothetical protein